VDDHQNRDGRTISTFTTWFVIYTVTTVVIIRQNAVYHQTFTTWTIIEFTTWTIIKRTLRTITETTFTTWTV
jgi:hypothetical protein